MADREKVIEGLEKVWDAFNHMEHELYADYVFDALELLKEQGPVKPRYEDFFGNRSTRCGYCNAYIVRFYEYCPGCGRKVKWDD